VLLFTPHGQEGVPLDHDIGVVQGIGEWANVVSRDVIRGQDNVRRRGRVPRHVVSMRIGHVRHLAAQGFQICPQRGAYLIPVRPAVALLDKQDRL